MHCRENNRSRTRNYSDKSHTILLKLLNQGWEENIRRNSPASALLSLKPAERHTRPSPINQSKGGELELKRLLQCVKLCSPLDPRAEARRSATTARVRISSLARAAAAAVGNSKPSRQQQPSMAPQITTTPAPPRRCSSPRNRKKPLKRSSKTTEPDQHFGSTPWRTPNPCGGGGGEGWAVGGGRGEGATPEARARQRHQPTSTTACTSTSSSRASSGVVVEY